MLKPHENDSVQQKITTKNRWCWKTQNELLIRTAGKRNSVKCHVKLFDTITCHVTIHETRDRGQGIKKEPFQKKIKINFSGRIREFTWVSL